MAFALSNGTVVMGQRGEYGCLNYRGIKRNENGYTRALGLKDTKYTVHVIKNLYRHC